MKRVLLFFSLMLIIGTSNIYSQMPVKDKGKWSVLNNMEFMDRVRLQPEWYHYWIWYKNSFAGLRVTRQIREGR